MMQTRSLLLDTNTWDLVLDDKGNIAVTDISAATVRCVASVAHPRSTARICSCLISINQSLGCRGATIMILR
jgi:hypothetical protein